MVYHLVHLRANLFRRLPHDIPILIISDHLQFVGSVYHGLHSTIPPLFQMQIIV